ncbi:MAG TPA: GGDEF domain-containing protein, partial [Proteobacteria bacterium]|nr:GGDEF domain-containing protein [Pseudomonadota bacterium]
ATLQLHLDQATENIRQLETRLVEVEKKAGTDSLTGINNRHSFEKYLQEVCRSCKREERFVMIMFDIDHFKQFNDNYGHRVGDLVIRNVAQLVAAELPAKGFVARYGGEEFAVILKDQNLDAGLAVAEHLRQIVASRELRRGRDGSRLGQVTISLGVAAGQAGADPETVVERADAALYRAKGNGRNRVEAASA